MLGWYPSQHDSGTTIELQRPHTVIIHAEWRGSTWNSHNGGVYFQLALDVNGGFGRSVASGALHGAAAWSAYALLEFLFASVLFRLARPHAVFSAWHWKLTAMLFLGYLIAGPVCGALAGAAAWTLRRRTQLSV